MSWILAWYLRLCLSTTRWQATGLEELEAALKNGPVILVLWHQRIMLSGQQWPKKWCRMKPIHDRAPAGRLAGATMAQFGLEPIAMSSKKSNFALSRLVIREMAAGVSIGLAADGPEGPVRQCKPAVIGWARATGHPVFLYAWATRRALRLNSWDRLLLPLPFDRGQYSFRKWETPVPGKLNQQTYDDLCTDLGENLDAVARDVDQLVGRHFEI